MNILRKIVVLVLLLIVSVPMLDAQRGRLERANASFEAGEYFEAIDKYKDAYNNLADKEIKPFIIFRMAECYRLTNNSKKAELWYKKAIGKDYPNPQIYLHYANALKMNEDYEEAIKQFEKYKEIVPDDPQADLGIESCELALKWIENPNGYVVEDMKFFNSKQSDYSPVFAEMDNSVVFFTSSREESIGEKTHGGTGYSFADIYMSRKDRKGAWSTPEPLPEIISTEFEEGACAISSDYNTMYFTRCRVDKKDKLGCEIYVTSRQGENDWTRPEVLDIAADSFVVAHPAIAPDDLTLYFVSDKPGGYGGKDIYLMRRTSTGDDWGTPENMGPEINTPGNEVFPFVHSDGTFYFSSDYHKGMGGLDIFKANQDEDGYWIVQNMRYPVNSPADDFGIVFEPEHERGFLSSSRNGLRWGDDIFAFYLPPLRFSVIGEVLNEKDDSPIEKAQIKLIGSDGTNITSESGEEGEFKFMLKANTDYIILASKDGFLNGKERETTRGLRGSKEFKTTIYLSSIAKPIELPNILYDLGRFDLRPESMVALDELVETLNDNPNITIELGSHTDSRGSDAINIELSQNRAETVVQYLIQNGIANDRLSARGYASTVPRVVDLKTAERYSFLTEGDVLNEQFISELENEEQREIAHQLNRRTEFKVLSTNYNPGN